MTGPIYILSGGAGVSGEQMVQTVLAQFPGQQVRVLLRPHLRELSQIISIVDEARQNEGTIVHTLVDSHLRQGLIETANQYEVCAIDLMGPLINRLSDIFQQSPLEQPGLYRKLNREYYERVAAIDFAMSHDDGKNPQDWASSDMLLLGVSRSGKTPTSLYLAVLGWKTANYPLVPGIEPPKELFCLDPKRVIGLHINAGQLLLHRQQRQKNLGTVGISAYSNPQIVQEEVDSACDFYRSHHIPVVDVTDKPIESCADEIIRLLQHT